MQFSLLSLAINDTCEHVTVWTSPTSPN